VLVFPCNQFGQQEPGTDAEIKGKLTSKFNVNFPIFSKVIIFTDLRCMYQSQALIIVLLAISDTALLC